MKYAVMTALALVLATPSMAQDAKAKVGSMWVYDTVDEITKVKGQFWVTVTEVSEDAIVTRYANSSNAAAVAVWVYDHDWNSLEGNGWKHTPHAGDGIQRPLVTDKAWEIDVESTWQQHTPNKQTAEGHVEGEEKVKTKGGTFDTFRIKIIQKVPLPSAQLTEQVKTATMWFAPKIDHFVWYTRETRVDGRLQERIVWSLNKYFLK